MNKDLNKKISELGSNITLMIPTLRREVVEQGYTPKYLMISKMYYDIMMEDSNLHYAGDGDFHLTYKELEEKYRHPKLFGLEILVTELPDVLEVY